MSIANESIWAASPSTTRGQPTPLSCDAKGARIAYASNKSIFLRSIDHPEISKQYTGHTAQTSVARFAPSGYYVASGDVSGSVRVWDCAGEGATKGEYHIIAGRINDIAWDGDSQRIIAVGDGKERYGHCITADSGNSVGEISGHSAQINCVSIRQQRPLRAATGSDDASLAFLHGAPFKYNTSMRGNHNKFIYGTQFSPDGSTLVSVGSDKKIWLYDGKTGEPQRQIGEDEHTGSIFGVSWSTDSRQFATCSADQMVKIWDAESGKVAQSWRMGGDGVSVPHQQVGVVWPHGRSDGLVISVDLEGNFNYLVQGNDKPVRIVRGHQKNITATVATPSTPRHDSAIWTGSSDGRVRVWDVASGTAADVDGESHSTYVVGLAAAANGSRVYSIGWDDTLRPIDSDTKSFTGSGVLSTEGQPKAVATAASSSTVFVATSSGIATSVDGKQTGSVEKLPAEATPTAIATSIDGTSLAATGSDKSLHIYTISSSSFKLAKSLTSIVNSPPSALCFCPNGNHLAIGTSSGGITVLSTSEWSITTSRWSAHTARVTSLAWSPDGKYAVSGSLDTNVFVWSLDSPGKRVQVGNAHKDGVSGVVWFDDGRVGSVGADAAVKVWKVQDLV